MREKSNSLFKQNSQQPHVFRGGEIKVMKKKIAAFVLATALVLPLSVPAFAATPSDVVGKPVQSAVEELTALGIISGYEDGTFKPENTITRAELAKVIVIGSGNEGAAKLMQTVKPTFKDVKANVWYTGYINAAATKGFILGDAGTKNFRPSDAVKFEEVVAVLVRSLGYQEKKLSGVWPYNYLLKAQDIGLFDNVDLNVGAKALRGVVAQLTSNTLNAKLVSYNVDGNEVLSSNSLISKLGNTFSATLLSSEKNSKGEIKLRYTEKNTAGVDTEVTKDVALATNFIVTGGKTLVDLLANNVTVVKGKDGKVLAITGAQDSTATLTGKLAAGQVAGSVKVTVGTKTETKATVSNAVYFVNGEERTLADARTNDKVTLYLVNDQVRAAVIENYAAQDSLVTTIEAKNEYRDARLTYTVGTLTGSVFVNDATAVTLDGKAAKLDDLKKDDVVSVIKKSDGKASKVIAVRNVATAKLESVVTGTAAKYTLGGKVYEAIDGVVADNVSTLTVANVGKEFTLILNADGKIVKASAPSAAANKPFVIVLDAVGVSIYENEVFVPKTKVTYFDIKANKNEIKYASATGTNAAPIASTTFTNVIGQLTELAFDADGKLTGVNAAVNVDVKGDGQAVDKISTTQINVLAPDTTYLIGANTVVVDATKLSATALADKKLSVGTLAQVTKNDKVYVSADGATANYIVIKKDIDAAATTKAPQYGLFVSAYKTQLTTTSATYSVVLNAGGSDQAPIEITGEAYDKLIDKATGAALVAKHSIVKLIDTPDTSALYDDVQALGVSANSIQVATTGQTANTFGINNDTVNGKYIVSGNTLVLVISADGSTVYTGSYTDISENAGNIANDKVQSVTVSATGTNIAGFKEAAVIVVKRK
jgi:hypothetical protein